MKKPKKPAKPAPGYTPPYMEIDTRLNPADRLCPMFDDRSIKDFRLPSHKMGVRVVDNSAEEHQM